MNNERNFTIKNKHYTPTIIFGKFTVGAVTYVLDDLEFSDIQGWNT